MVKVKGNHKLADILLGIARSDLEAAKCLYENKLYPQAIFHLQQSAEKADKSFALIIGLTTEEDLKTHNTLNFDKKILNEVKNKIEIWKDPTSAKTIEREIKKVVKGKKIPQEIIKKIKENEENEADIISKSKKSLPINDDDIKKMNQYVEKQIESINSYNKEKNHIEKNHIPSDQEVQQQIKELLGSIKKVDEFKLYAEEQVKEIRKHYEPLVTGKKTDNLKTELKKLLLESNYSLKDADEVSSIMLRELLALFINQLSKYSYYLSLHGLSVIMYPHAIATRYPNNGFNPLEIYTDSYQLIGSFNMLADILSPKLNTGKQKD